MYVIDDRQYLKSMALLWLTTGEERRGSTQVNFKLNLSNCSFDLLPEQFIRWNISWPLDLTIHRSFNWVIDTIGNRISPAPQVHVFWGRSLNIPHYIVYSRALSPAAFCWRVLPPNREYNSLSSSSIDMMWRAVDVRDSMRLIVNRLMSRSSRSKPGVCAANSDQPCFTKLRPHKVGHTD